MEKKIKRNSFIIGIIGAIVTASIYVYMWQAQDYLNHLLNTSIYIYPIIFGVIAQVVARVVMKGTISFKQTVLAYFVCIILIYLTEFVVYYSILNYFDTGAKQILTDAWQAITNKTQSGLAKSNVFKMPSYSFSEFALGFATKTLMFTVPGLITGLVISKIPQGVSTNTEEQL